MKKYIKYFSAFFFSVLLGMLIYRNNWFPRPQINYIKEYLQPSIIVPEIKSNEKIVCLYSKGVPLFTDRDYVDSKGNLELENSFIIQIPRHFNRELKLVVHSNIKVYRVLSEVNDNSIFNDWEQTEIKLEIIGQSCIHKNVVSKVFEAGELILHSGGPISSSPILIKSVFGPENCIPFSIIEN